MNKPGYRTSEFYLFILANAFIALEGVPIPDGFEWIKIAAPILTYIGYALSRGLAKSTQVEVPVPIPVNPETGEPIQPPDPVEEASSADIVPGKPL